MKLLVLAALSLVNALSLYEYQCPHPAQWNLRSRILCKSEQNRISYSCLYDEHNNTYIESCSENADFVRPGQKYVRVFQRSNVDCMKTRYQPIKFWSNLNSQCILSKSFCNELGQKIFSVGSTREDTKCYCDYEKGFLYITKPSHTCYCVPAEEDCSCYNECTGRKQSYGCLLDKQIENLSKCFQSLNDTINTVSSTIHPQTDSTELGNDEINDGYKLIQWKNVFYKMLVVLSICVTGLGPTILAFKMFTCKDLYECVRNGSRTRHKSHDKYLIDTGRNEEIPSIIIHEQQQLQPEKKVKSTSQLRKNYRHFEDRNLSLEREKSWNEINIEKQSPLLQASIRGNLDTLKVLFQNGCNLNVKNESGFTPLMMASLNGHTDVVNHLIHIDVDLNSRDNFGKTAVFYATEESHFEVIRMLITKKCDINIANNSGETPFVHSIKKECFEVADLLISGGANIHEVNANDETALWIACHEGKVAAVEYLIGLGFDVNKTNKNKQTSLWLACNNGLLEIVKILIKYKGDVNKADMRSWTPLKAAASRGCADICEYLLSHKADVNKADEEGWTPLMSACREGHQFCVEILIKNKADCQLWNHQEKTALWLASQYGKESIVRLLLSKSDINKCDHKNRTPLDAASSSGHIGVCNLLRSVNHKS